MNNFSDNSYFFHFLKMMQFAFLNQSTGKEYSCSGRNPKILCCCPSFPWKKGCSKPLQVYMTAVHRLEGFNSPLLPNGALQLTCPNTRGCSRPGEQVPPCHLKNKAREGGFHECMKVLMMRKQRFTSLLSGTLKANGEGKLSSGNQILTSPT